MKKIYSRSEFEDARKQWAENMHQDQSLRNKALDVFIEADRHNWIHQTNWLGEPSLQTPEDLITFQEIIFRTRPDFLVEVGVAWAGSLLFYATIMESIGHGQIIGIDIFIPDDLKDRIFSHSISKRIKLIQSSSIEDDSFREISGMIGENKNTMVHLDSDHTEKHVLQELKLYSELVTKGNYLVCGDTIIDFLPEQTHRPREWGKINNPYTALKKFLSSNNRFVVDQSFDMKRLMSNQPGGYLRCIK